MALVLFRSYVLLIVLCIFITLIDKSHGEKKTEDDASTSDQESNVSNKIPNQCRIYFGINNQIIFPKNFKVHTFNVNSGKTNDDSSIGKTNDDSSIVKLPEGYFVIVPEGFEINHPAGEQIPPDELFDKTNIECKSHLQTGWTISPTTELKNITNEISATNKPKDGSPDGGIDVILNGMELRDGDVKHGFEIAIEVAIPKCKIILPKNNTVIIPEDPNYIINYNYSTINDDFYVHYPTGDKRTFPDGFKARTGSCRVPQKDWIKPINGEIIVELPEGWIVQPTDALRETIKYIKKKMEDIKKKMKENELEKNELETIKKKMEAELMDVLKKNELETIKKKMEDIKKKMEENELEKNELEKKPLDDWETELMDVLKKIVENQS